LKHSGRTDYDPGGVLSAARQAFANSGRKCPVAVGD
jgi:hypothetical protein